MTAQRGASLVALLGLEQAVAAGEGAVQFEGTANGVWGAPLRLNAKLWGAGMDADAQGTADPSTSQASVNLRVRSVNLAPIFGLPPSDSSLRNVRLFARASLAGNKLTFDDLDSVAAGSRLRGRLTLNLDDQRSVDGEIGLDALDLTSGLAFAIGAAGHDAAEPFTSGLVKGWRGRIAFQALGGALPDGAELRPVSGTIRSDGQSLTLDAIKGRIGGGDVTATIDAKQDAAGISLNGRLELAGVDGAALHYRGLKMPAGRTSLQMTLSSQGRSVAALVGALSGSGTATLDSGKSCGARSARLRCRDPRQRLRPADRRGAVATDRRPRAVRRQPAGCFGADSVQHQGRAPSHRRDHAGGLRRARHHIRRLRFPGGSGGHSRQPCIDRAGCTERACPKSSSSRSVRPTRCIARSMSPRCRRGLRCGRSIAKRGGWIRSSVASRCRPSRRGAAVDRVIAVSRPGARRFSVRGAGRPRRLAPKPRVLAPRPPAVAPPPIVSQQVAPLPPPIDVKPVPGSPAPSRSRARRWC